MFTKDDKIQIIKAIITNSLDNNIYTRAIEPHWDVVRTLEGFIKKYPQQLDTLIALGSEYALAKDLKYYLLIILMVNNHKIFKPAFEKYINTIQDIYKFSCFLEANKEFSIKFTAQLKKMLKNKLESITEFELAHYFGNRYRIDQIDFNYLNSFYKPQYNNPHIGKTIEFIFGDKYMSAEYLKSLPILNTLNKIMMKDESIIIEDLINNSNYPSSFIISAANRIDSHTLWLLFREMSYEEFAEYLPIFLDKGYIDKDFCNDYFRLCKIQGQEHPGRRFGIHRVYLGANDIDNPATAVMAMIELALSKGVPNVAFSIPAILMDYRKGKYSWLYDAFQKQRTVFTEAPHVELPIDKLMIFLDGSSSETIDPLSDTWHCSFFPDRIPIEILLFLIRCIRYRNKRDEGVYKYSKKIYYEQLELLIKSESPQRPFNPYGSDPLLPIQYLLENNIKSDLTIIFTDYDYTFELSSLWDNYRNNIYKDGSLILVQLSPFYEKPLPTGNNYYRLLGWSENTFELIINILNINNIVNHKWN